MVVIVELCGHLVAGTQPGAAADLLEAPGDLLVVRVVLEAAGIAAPARALVVAELKFDIVTLAGACVHAPVHEGNAPAVVALAIAIVLLVARGQAITDVAFTAGHAQHAVADVVRTGRRAHEAAAVGR